MFPPVTCTEPRISSKRNSIISNHGTLYIVTSREEYLLNKEYEIVW